MAGAVGERLLALRARAEFAAGDTLDGIRTLEARALLLSGTDERRENYASLVGALSASPAVTATVSGDRDALRAREAG